jgi:hypothetical protein
MELLTLDSDYQPAELVERYASLLWTERYSTTGDFQLVTTDVERMLKLLPLESCVTVRDSTVPMVVEVHKLQKGKDGAPKLTVTGRSFDSVLERRAAVKFETPSGARVEWIETRAKASDAAYQAIRQTIGDVYRPPLLTQLPMNSVNDMLSMVDLPLPADYEDAPATTYTYEVKPGNLYSVAMELLSTNHHGLKAVRPVPGQNKIALEIYNGADLTNLVVFDARFDQFEDSTYLLSYAGSGNWAYVSSKTGSQTVNKTQAAEPTDLARRVLYVDVSSDESADSEDARRTRGLIELYNYNVTAMFDGKLADQLIDGFNKDYFLGDIIRLDGEYGLSENVRVSEFIRSDDNTGSKAYPTFEVVV